MTGELAPFQTDITHTISASSLAPGDAVNNSDHVMLFKEWVTPGKVAVFIEAHMNGVRVAKEVMEIAKDFPKTPAATAALLRSNPQR